MWGGAGAVALGHARVGRLYFSPKARTHIFVANTHYPNPPLTHVGSRDAAL